ncbi:MAG: GNAT family N-acetyltransferase [Candidatus Woesearchaeota archaeon]
MIISTDIQLFESQDQIDIGRIINLIQEGFGKKLTENYLQTEDISCIVIGGDYQGTAVLQDYNGWVYLDKFVVSPQHRNNGVGSEIFSYILQNIGMFSEKSGLFWRSSGKNSLNRWYLKKIIEMQGGCRVKGEWVVYWIGGSQGDLDDIVEYGANKPHTLM